jgi:hypothetical protein
MVAGSQRPGDAASRAYWRRRCEGFRVDSPNGRVGVVEEVGYVSRSDRPDLIAVRAGLFARLLLVVPVGEVAEIVPSEERIFLRHPPRQTATERLRELRRRVEGLASGFKQLDAHREVKAVIDRLRHLIGPRPRKGGEREMTPEAEASAEPSAEEPPAEEQAGKEPAAEEPAAEETPAEEEPTV